LTPKGVDENDHRLDLRLVARHADHVGTEEEAMVKEKVDGVAWLRKQVETQDRDLLRELVKAVVEELMSADTDAVCGATYRQATPERTNRRNGYRERRWDTRVGTIDLAIPRLRKGTYFPDWLLEPRRRSERALVWVVCECYVRGVSTRRVDGLVRTLGLEGMSKSQVSELAKKLDTVVEEFRNRPLRSGPYAFMWLDALTQRCREGGRVVNVVTVVATAVNADGHREVLGDDVVTSEDVAGWEAFLRQLVGRGLSRVELVISDDHQGLKAALAQELPGASWQGCWAHFMRNVLTKVPKGAQDLVATLIRSVFAQPARDEVWAQLERVIEQLRMRFPKAAEALEEAAEDILAFSSFPKTTWRQIWSNNPQERLNREIRRRTDVVGIFPNRAAIIRLVGAVLAEQTDEWAVTRRYMTQEALAQASALRGLPSGPKEETALVAQLAA
jgi:transposase-like protein